MGYEFRLFATHAVEAERLVEQWASRIHDVGRKGWRADAERTDMYLVPVSVTAAGHNNALLDRVGMKVRGSSNTDSTLEVKLSDQRVGLTIDPSRLRFVSNEISPRRHTGTPLERLRGSSLYVDEPPVRWWKKVRARNASPEALSALAADSKSAALLDVSTRVRNGTVELRRVYVRKRRTCAVLPSLGLHVELAHLDVAISRSSADNEEPTFAGSYASLVFESGKSDSLVVADAFVRVLRDFDRFVFERQGSGVWQVPSCSIDYPAFLRSVTEYHERAWLCLEEEREHLDAWRVRMPALHVSASQSHRHLYGEKSKSYGQEKWGAKGDSVAKLVSGEAVENGAANEFDKKSFTAFLHSQHTHGRGWAITWSAGHRATRDTLAVISVRHARVEELRLLLSIGANVHHVCHRGRHGTLAHVAARTLVKSKGPRASAAAECLRVLVEYGANVVYVRDDLGRTVLDVLRSHGPARTHGDERRVKLARELELAFFERHSSLVWSPASLVELGRDVWTYGVPDRSWRVGLASKVSLVAQRPNRVRCASLERGVRVRLVVLSDTHAVLPRDYLDEVRSVLREDDILVHCGDFCGWEPWENKLETLRVFDEWLGTLPCERRLLIGGNHDTPLDERFVPSDVAADDPRIRVHNVTRTLRDEWYVSKEGIRFYGSPWTCERPVSRSPARAHHTNRGREMARIWDRIPADERHETILLTHSPPWGIGDHCARGADTGPLDDEAGCVDLRCAVQQRIRPLLHLYGHSHRGRGAYRLPSPCETVFVNCVQWPFESDSTGVGPAPPVFIELHNDESE